MKVVVVGAGPYAQYVSYVLTIDSPHDVVAHCVEERFLDRAAAARSDLPIVAFAELQRTYPPQEHALFIAVGNNAARERIMAEAEAMEYRFVTYVSSLAGRYKNDNVTIGRNTFIDGASGISPFSRIGDNCILFGARLGHHVTIGDHVLLSGCTLGGNVVVGDGTFIGMHAAVGQKVTIAKRNIIGMGCIIERDTCEGDVFSHKGTVKRDLKAWDLADRLL